jgi:hypothetical protein
LVGSNPDVIQELTTAGHFATGYIVFVSHRLNARWAEVICSCGVHSKALWDDTVRDYCGLVHHAWFLGCGFVLPRDMAIFQRHDDTQKVLPPEVMNRVYASHSQWPEGPERR